MITLTDNGPGISKNIISDISIHSVLQNGRLRASCVAKIISEHGGFVELDDMYEGACFKIYLPAGNDSESGRIY